MSTRFSKRPAQRFLDQVGGASCTRRGTLTVALIATIAVLGAGVQPTLATASTAAPGDVYAFGENLFGELGDAINEGTLEPNPAPAHVALPGATGPATELAVGNVHSLVITSTGQLYAFGKNRYGQLGNATNENTEEPNPTPALVTLPGATGAPTEVAGGNMYSLALTSSNQLYAFGENRLGQLGNATNEGTEEPNPTPTLVTLPGATGPVTEIAAGSLHSLVMTSTGQLYAFGDNQFGQLGNATNEGTEEPNPTPTLVTLPGAIGPVTQIAAGGFHSLALTSTGQLYAFGENRYGQLGNATNENTEEPNPTPTLVTLPGATGPIAQIAAGYKHSLALTSSGQLYAFGENRYGQLGDETNTRTGEPNPTPVPVTLPGTTGRVGQIAAGAFHSLALTSTGQLYVFGWNIFGQLGDEMNDRTSEPNPTPVLVTLPGGASIEKVARGAEAFYALTVVSGLGVSTASLPSGTVGAPYSTQVRGTGGAAPYRWAASGLPPGLSVSAASGAISGTPSTAGTYTATFTVSDAGGIEASARLVITITPPAATTGLATATRALSCPSPSGRLAGSSLGVLKLGMTRSRAHRALRRFTISHHGFENFCLGGGFGISAGFPTLGLLRSLPARLRARVRGRIALLLTANPYYSLRGARPGMPFARLAAHLRIVKVLAVRGHAWYIAPGKRVNGVIEVTGGTIRYVGTAEKLPMRAPGTRRLLLTG